MDYLKAINKLLPNWNGAVWGNTYEGIKPDISETRATPLLSELEAAWIIVEAEELKIKNNNEVYAKLTEIDLKSIRAMRDGDTEYISQYKEEAIAERAKLL